jgi:hypothetical protein|tara:strand:+ start:1321 stop:1857 length:537 start_codon:yes stop_codon:yes gene_type:complete
MLNEIKNPITENYLLLKKIVLSDTFPWFWKQHSTDGVKEEGFTNIPFFSHCILDRPSNDLTLYPRESSEHIRLVDQVLKEIFSFNNIKTNCILRINFNCIHYIDGKPTIPHLDHDFAHENLLIYFDNSEGDTLLYNEDHEVINVFSPKEDSIIIFDGIHGSGQPLPGQKRIVMVATFI